MSFKTTYILFGLLIVQLVIFGLLQFFGPPPGSDIWVLPQWHREEVQADAITKVEIDRRKPAAVKIVFEREADTKRWLMTQPYRSKVETFSVDAIIRNVIGARKEDVELRGGLSGNDLDPPDAVVTLTQSDGSTASIHLGKVDLSQAEDRMVAVNSSERPDVVLAVEWQSIDHLFKTAKEFRTKDTLAASALNILSVKLSDAKHTLALKKTGDLQWAFVQPPYGEADYHGQPKKPAAEEIKLSGVQELLNTVEGIRVEYNADAKIDDFVAENVKDLDKYGLGKTPATMSIQGRVRVGSQIDQGLEGPSVEDTLRIGKPVDDKQEKYYACLASEGNVFKVSAKSFKPLLQVLDHPDQLRNKDLVKLNVPDVDAVNIENQAGVIQLRRVGTPPQWQLVQKDGAIRAADPRAVQQLLNVLTTQRVSSFPKEPDAELGLDDKSRVAVVSIWEKGIAPAAKDAKEPDKKEKEKKKEEKKPAPIRLKSETPNVTLVFGKKNKEGDLVYVKREAAKQSTKLAVPEELLAQVSEGRLAYIDKVLPSFGVTNVTRVTVERDGKSFVMIQDDQDGKTTWKFEAPKELKGRRADESKIRNIIGDLRNPFPERFVAEKPDQAQLEKFGLAKPVVKVVITVSKEVEKDKKKIQEAKEYVFLFGKRESKEGPVYAKVGDSDLVFLVQADLLQPMQGELMDLRVFDFDTTKVRSLKVVGWKEGGKDKTFFVERNKDAPAEWVVKNAKELPEFMPDHAKIERFIYELSRLSAERFLVINGKPRPQDGLDPRDRQLQVEIQMEQDSAKKEKDPALLTLSIGALIDDKDTKGYAAQGNTLPLDVFLLRPVLWEQVLKEGEGYFGVPKKKEEKKDE